MEKEQNHFSQLDLNCLKELNFEKQNEYLMSKGYMNVRKNIKHLKQFNGNAEAVLNQIEEKKKAKFQRLKEKAKELGIEEQLNQLLQKGYDQIDMCFRALLHCQKDVDQAESILKIKIINKNQRKQKMPWNEIEEKYQNQLNQLAQKGYQKKRKNLKLLRKCNGDLEKVIQLITDKEEFIKKREDNHKQFEQFLSFFTEHGFTKPKKVFKALEKCKGNKEQALEALLQKQLKKCHLGEKQPKSNEIKNEEQQQNQQQDNSLNKSKTDYRFFRAQGYYSHKLIQQALSQNQGDQDKALGWLNDNSKQKDSLKHDSKEFQQLDEFLTKKWPQGLLKLYLDGNNMLFVDEKIRKTLLHKNKQAAELALGSLSKSFACSKGIVDTLLLFDQTNLVYTDHLVFNINKNLEIEQKQYQTLTFNVQSSRPQFKTSDDYLVELCEKEILPLEKVLFVTSDVELLIRLQQKGAKNLMKSGVYMQEIQNELGKQVYDNILSNLKN